MADPRIEAAISHWAPRYAENGVPVGDFLEVTGSIDSWDDWCAAWSARGAVHEAEGDRALANGHRRSAASHFNTAAVCYHFGKFLFTHDLAQMKAAHRHAIRAHRKAHPLFDESVERLEIPYGERPPLPRPRRFAALGHYLRDAIAADESDKRVALITTGHLATDIGGPRQFLGGDSPDPAFDADAVAWIAGGDLDVAVEGCTVRSIGIGWQCDVAVPQYPCRPRRRRPDARLRRRYRLAFCPRAILLLGHARDGVSRFDINKFMMFVDGTSESLEEFCRDRQRFINGWIQSAADSERPIPHGGPLSDEEQRALIELDVGTLYEMGSHPYILLHFARAVEVDFNGIPFPDFDRAYKKAVTPHGYPNFAT